ncbi:NUDIX hydrolase [Halorarius litoreus]|uniref:NUDIX hydrolase n=1 Tax=Halorarius litoreus TaxID=2962676 RepID=UPI0020CDF012|nr:NUDIX domain-containing protein [Halorarius litoreus]
MSDRQAVVDCAHRRTERLLADVREAFPDAPTLDPWVIDPPRYFDDSFPEVLDVQLDRWAGIGGANVFREHEGEPQVLCVKPGYKDHWEGPGGDLEVGESLAETAKREVREETNYEVELTGVFYAREVHIDYGPPEPVPIPMTVFTARVADGRLAAPSHRVPSGEPEIEDARWFSKEELPEPLVDAERIYEYLEEMG